MCRRFCSSRCQYSRLLKRWLMWEDLSFTFSRLAIFWYLRKFKGKNWHSAIKKKKKGKSTLKHMISIYFFEVQQVLLHFLWLVDSREGYFSLLTVLAVGRLYLNLESLVLRIHFLTDVRAANCFPHLILRLCLLPCHKCSCKPGPTGMIACAGH